MNFRKYYINGNRFTFTFNFRGDMYWNSFMYWLTKKTTKIQKPHNTVVKPTKMVEVRFLKDRPEQNE